MVLLRILVAIIWIFLGLSVGGYLVSVFPASYPSTLLEHITWWHRLQEIGLILFHLFMVYAGVITLVRLNVKKAWGHVILSNTVLRKVVGGFALTLALMSSSTIITILLAVKNGAVSLQSIMTNLYILFYLVVAFLSMAMLLLLSRIEIANGVDKPRSMNPPESPEEHTFTE